MKVFAILLSCVALAASINFDWKKHEKYGKDWYHNQKTYGDFGDFDQSKYGYDKSYEDFSHGYGDKFGGVSDVHHDYEGFYSSPKFGEYGVGSYEQDYVPVKENFDFDKIKYAGYKFDDLKHHVSSDKYLLQKQKFILDVFRNVYSTLVLDDIRDVHHFVEGESNYVNFDRVATFFRKCSINKACLLPRGHVFSINNSVHRRETIALFNLFFYSKDFSVFQRNVLWARNFVNEGMFVYALTAAIFHRHDLIGVKLPAHYEIVPHMFHNSLTISKAVSMKMGNFHEKNMYVLANYSSDIFVMNDESKLAYFTEDIGWNLFHFYFHMAYPFWLGGEDFTLFKERRGEKFLYILQQILARYYLERLSHKMGDIEDFSFNAPIKTGYNSYMRHFNGLAYSVRKNYYDVYTTEDFYLIDRVTDFERRIRDAIDLGYCTAFDGGKVDLKRFDTIDILGNLIQSNGDSVNERYFGNLIRWTQKLLGGGHFKFTDHMNILPSVMEYYETALRDPVTYQLYKYILKFYYQFKNNLPAYTKDDLFVKGVHIDNIYVSKLVTYFDYFDVDISTIVDHDFKTSNLNVHSENADTFIHARHMRLNHKPFYYKLDVVSDRAQKVVVRTFIGPKFDEFGKLLSLKYNRDNFVEIDKLFFDLPVGKVSIKRESRDFTYTVSDRTTYFELYQKILLNKDIGMLEKLNIDESHCGFPDRLLLPKGWVGGMPMQIFSIITQATDIGKHDDYVNVCGRYGSLYYADKWSLGFPFDRRVDVGEFYTPNMLFKDVFIYHDTHDTFETEDFDKKFLHTDYNFLHTDQHHV